MKLHRKLAVGIAVAGAIAAGALMAALSRCLTESTQAGDAHKKKRTLNDL